MGDVLRTISKAQKRRLQLLGATVTKTTITATEAMFWRAPIVGEQRSLLTDRGLLVTGPDWLPAGAAAFVDFRAADAASVHCYAGGQVVTDINTQFAAIENVGTSFHPELISSLGLGGSASSPSFIGDFLAAVLSPSGSRVVYTGKTIAAEFGVGTFGQETGDSSNYNHEMDAVAGADPGGPTYIYNDSHQINFGGNLLVPDAINTIEIVMSPTLQSIQVNGGDVLTAVPASPDSYSQIAIVNTIGYLLYLQTITVYAL